MTLYTVLHYSRMIYAAMCSAMHLASLLAVDMDPSHGWALHQQPQQLAKAGAWRDAHLCIVF